MNTMSKFSTQSAEADKEMKSTGSADKPSGI